MFIKSFIDIIIVCIISISGNHELHQEFIVGGAYINGTPCAKSGYSINPQSIVLRLLHNVFMATGEKTVQYTKRGLKVVGPKSVFDLDEPPWIPDEKVFH